MKCPECESELIQRSGRYGQFMACSAWPKCKHTESLSEEKEEMPRRDLGAIYLIGDEPWVNASGIGQVEFCPHSFYLRKTGIQQSKEAVQRMQKGTYEHARVSSDRRCYIATHALGEDHPVTHELRIWRDRSLMGNYCGRFFVKSYYFLSPLLIKAFGRNRVFNALSRKLVLLIARLVRPSSW